MSSASEQSERLVQELRFQAVLEELKKPVQYLKGVGPQRTSSLLELGIKSLNDLLFHIPRDFQDRSHIVPIADLEVANCQYVVGDVVSVNESLPKSQNVRHILKAIVTDGSGQLQVVWFNQRHLAHSIVPGATLALYGTVDLEKHQMQMLSPEWEIVVDENPESRTGIIPIYPLSQGLSQKALRAIILESLRRVRDDVPDWLPESVRSQRGLLRWSEAIRMIHWPGGSMGMTSKTGFRLNFERARKRLSYDELFTTQMTLALNRITHMEKPGIAHELKYTVKNYTSQHCTSTQSLCHRFVEQLPFRLTKAQVRAMGEIEDDMASRRPMYRLLQGDVGSGKTVVLLYGMLVAVENGKQAALMALTEVLAQQHYATLMNLSKGLGLSVALLYGGLGLTDAKKTRAELAMGRVNLLIGTHALFQEKTEFSSLSMVVVDEQHRFGVGQRQAFQAKGDQ
ncbi:MAG TPA: DEAD/DEAH box helicase, partial [bacterium]|nr:DEAD/DEAH box helicase [bacterium]